MQPDDAPIRLLHQLLEARPLVFTAAEIIGGK